MATFTQTFGTQGGAYGSQAIQRAQALAATYLPSARTFIRDLAIVLGVMGLYFIARGQAPARLDASVTLTTYLVDIERYLFVFWEPQIQDASIQWHWSKELANFTYAYLHFPVLAAVGIWLWFKDRRAFVFLRNVMFVSMLIGLVFYYTMPAAPPRLMAAHGYDFGFTDTVFSEGTSVSYAQPSLIVNEYAAIPSFHFGWIALASAALWLHTDRRSVKAAALFLTLLMSWAIVASANHLFIDMALGGLVIIASWRIARRLERAPRSQAAAEAGTQRRVLVPHAA
jgi:hypothetical protein